MNECVRIPSEMELGNPYDTLHITNDFLFMTSVPGEQKCVAGKNHNDLSLHKSA